MVCPSGDLQLQTLIYVYNALLGEENQKRFCMEFEELEPYKNYVAQREGGPGKGTLCKDTEWKFEIILGDKK